MSARNGTKAFTLVEMTVVLLVIVLFAFLVMPNLLTQKTAVARRAAYGKVLDMARTARTRAINEDTTYALAFDSGKSELRLVRQPLAQDTNSSSSLPNPEQRPLTNIQSVNDYEQVDTYDLPSGIQGQKFRSGESDTDPGSWLLHFYPDGTSDSGGLELNEGGMPSTIMVDQYGMSTFTKNAQLPDVCELNWTAGTYVSMTPNTAP